MPPNAQRGGSGGGGGPHIPPAPRGIAHPLWHLIYSYSQQLRLDPYAVAAVSLVEGGGRFGAVGDNGSSYGPFQLHRGGALPAGMGPGFANSPHGVFYAMSQMASSGAAGLHGLAAIRAIVTRFERPAAPGAEIDRGFNVYQGHSGVDPGFNVNMPRSGVDPGFNVSLRKMQASQEKSMAQQQRQFLAAMQAQAAQTRQQSLAQVAAQQLFQRHQAAAQAQMALTGQPAAGLAGSAQSLAAQNQQKTQDLRDQALRRAGIA